MIGVTVLTDGAHLKWGCEECTLGGIGWIAMMNHMRDSGHEWFHADPNGVHMS